MHTNMYKPEGMNGTRELPDFSLAALERARETGKILEATANICTPDMALKVNLGTITGIIPKEEAALTSEGEKVKDIAVITRVGKPVCFQVQRIEQQTAYLSRRSAQQQALRHLMTRHRPGDIIDVRVTHLEPFGAFVDAGCGIVSLIGIENLSVSRIFHPSDRVRIGQKLKAVISSLDPDTGRICLTHRELLGTWEENAAQFTPGETVCGIVRSVEDYGVFVELTPNLSGLAEQRFPVTPGETVSCYIKSILPERMKIKLNLIDHINQSPASPPPLTYFIESRHLSRWQYSPSSCTTRLVQTEFDPPTIEDF